MVEFSKRIKYVDGTFSRFFSPTSGSIDLSVGIPGFDTPEHIKYAAYKSLKNGRVKYTLPQGDRNLRELIADIYREKYGVECGPENIIITHGAKGAIFALMQCVIDEGDRVLIQDPGWPSYSEIAKIAGGVPVSIRANSEKEFLKDIESKVSKKTKLVIFSTPSNPTGHVYNKSMLKSLWEMANDQNFLVVSDEPYHEIIFDKKNHESVGRYGLNNTVIVNSFSKTYCMSGWRIGYLIAEEQLIKTLAKFQLHQSTCVPPFIQDAAKQALLHDWDGVEKRREIYERRRDLFLSLVGKYFNGEKPEGAFYYFPSVAEFDLSGEEFSMELSKRGLLCVPGSLFGRYGKYNVRFTFSKPEGELRRASEIIREYMESI